jgi:hypothetical protein
MAVAEVFMIPKRTLFSNIPEKGFSSQRPIGPRANAISYPVGAGGCFSEG